MSPENHVIARLSAVKHPTDDSLGPGAPKSENSAIIGWVSHVRKMQTHIDNICKII